MEEQGENYRIERAHCPYLDLKFSGERKVYRNGNLSEVAKANDKGNRLEVLLKVEKDTLDPVAIICPAYEKSGRCSVFPDVGHLFHLLAERGEYDCVFKRGWRPLPQNQEKESEKANRRF